MHTRALAMISVWLFSANILPTTLAQDSSDQEEPRRPLSIRLIEMDISGADKVLTQHDLDDSGVLTKTELERLKWGDSIKRFDLNRDGKLEQVEIALKLADQRLDAGVVQMDHILSERYMSRHDRNRDGKLSFDELRDNSFTDQLDSYDKNSDDEISSDELIRGLAWERRFRDELGIKGCDQGGAMKLINKGDQNRDKRIDSTELDAAGLAEDVMEFDRNDDGKLSVSELAEKLAQRRNQIGLTPSDQLAVRAMMRGLDRDSDGKITGGEFPPAQPNSPLTQADADSNGQVTEPELEVFFGKRRRELGFDDDDEKRATTLIQRNDSDRSRTLSRTELEASGSDRSSPLSPTKLSIIDQNGDRMISMNELAKYLHKTK